MPRATQKQTLKRLRVEEGKETDTTVVDRLTDLPESLQLHILSSLETKHAFKTSVLSKSWASKWTCVPVLNFSSYGFKKLNEFDKFVFNTLSIRRSAKLEKLTFRRHGICSAKILNKEFDYAFSGGVKELDVSIIRSRKDKSWPILEHMTSDSLTSLKLDSNSNMGCSFLGPRSGAFNKLTSLYLKRVIIGDLDPFSGFPALKKLTLVSCNLLQTDGTTNTLNVHAPQLLELTISDYYVNRCQLTTPNLRDFNCQGCNFPRLQAHQGGLPVLDTVVIDFIGSCRENQRRKTFDDLMMLFNSLHSAKSLTLDSAVVQLLTFFPDELAKRCSPFPELKFLKVDFSRFHCQRLFEGDCRSLSELLKVVPSVKGYLLKNSHEAKCTMVYPDYDDPLQESTCSTSQASKRCKCVQISTIKLEGK
ncbi:putative F-box domain, leucine-rich repeat domain superfamily [Helianthus annuus]|nr:putative F-box domain, leucine-rich repeat domain superfamily [Helianthus annuus]